jgi:hypothetical protein
MKRKWVRRYRANAGEEDTTVHAGMRGEQIGALGVEQQVAALFPAIALAILLIDLSCTNIATHISISS